MNSSILSTRHAPPHASTMIESLRGLGYSTASAIADILDNGISAGASEINIQFNWRDKQSSIYILDNGSGLSDKELERAMTLGVKSPLDQRSANDLGRFGMGLKTASFSQCKRLTVASKFNDTISCLSWDLDLLSSRPDLGWALIEGAPTSAQDSLLKLEQMNQGTIVIWEVLDRILTEGFTSDDFLALIEDVVEPHLSMVFGRLLEGTSPALKIYINGRKVQHWDPFMTGHPSKPWISPVKRHPTTHGVIEIQCHVLPHKDRLTETEFTKNAGPNGWAAQQGFYIYRNKRLLVGGGWLGLGSPRAWNRDEPHRLARIRLDLPNTADMEWKIDVKKSVARPPVAVREWLTRMANDTRERARQVFAYRGTPTKRTNGSPIEQVWKVDRTVKGSRYRIDIKHPSIACVLECANESQKELILCMVRVLEETVPVQKIWLDTAENKDTPATNFSSSSDDAVFSIMQTLLNDMVMRKGMTLDEAQKSLLFTDPFHNFPHLISKLCHREL